MRYGNTFKTILPGICMMALTGCIAGVIGLFAMIAKANFQVWPAVILLFIILPTGFFLICAPTLLFCIKIENERVQHLFLDRYVLSDYPVADFVKLIYGGGNWPHLQFTQNRTIYFYGAYLGEMGRLEKDLLVVNKDIRRNQSKSVNETL